MLSRLLALFREPWPKPGMVPTGRFCESCGSPMVAHPKVVTGYSSTTGKPITRADRAYCSRDEFCGLWGLPGF